MFLLLLVSYTQNLLIVDMTMSNNFLDIVYNIVLCTKIGYMIKKNQKESYDV
jgi:hypothetical protein